MKLGFVFKLGILTVFFLAMSAKAAQSRQTSSIDYMAPGHVDALVVVPKDKRSSVHSGKCAMALLSAVKVNNAYHQAFKGAPTIQDRTIGQGSHIADFECFADPDGREYFYLELSISLDDDTNPISDSGMPKVTRYFTFDIKGNLNGWLL